MHASFILRSWYLLILCVAFTACTAKEVSEESEDFSPKKTVEMEGVETVDPAEGWKEVTQPTGVDLGSTQELFDPEVEPSDVEEIPEKKEVIPPEMVVPSVSPLTPTKEAVVEIKEEVKPGKPLKIAQVDQTPADQLSVIYFFDYATSQTAQLEKMIQGLRKMYGAGVLWIYRPIGNFGGSRLGAMASECAKAQDSWEIFHEGLLNLSGSIDQEAVEALVKTLDLDKEAFDTCLKSTRTEGALQAFSKEAESLNVKEVPAFVVAENVVFSGKYPASLFEQLLKSSIKGRLK